MDACRTTGRVSISSQPTLHLLSHRIKILSIDKSLLPFITHTLLGITLKLLDRDPLYRRDSFYSFTETNTEYSLLLDQTLYNELQESSSFNYVNVADGIWRPIVIEVGALSTMTGTGLSKIAANVISPLADVGVSVFCLSSNQEDYVMIKESDLERSLKCLCCDHFRLICDSDRYSDIQLIESVTLLHNSKTHSSSSIPRLITHPFCCSTVQYEICSIMSTALPLIVQPLLQLMFFSSKREFFSFSIIGGNITLVTDATDIKRFPSDSVYAINSMWRLFTIGNSPLGFDECGIVAQISSPLAEQDISSFYICTFNTDHILIYESNTVEAMELLTEYTSSTK